MEKKNIQTVLVLPDAHLTTKKNEVYELVKKFVSSRKWDEIVLLGDFIDFESLNPWMENKTLLLENKRYLDEIEMANRELDFLQKYAKKITYLEGNHERRAVWYTERHPEMHTFIDVQKNLNLKKRNIEWIPYDNHSSYQKGHLTFIHGYWWNRHHASKHLERFGCNVVYGHTHGINIAQMRMLKQKEYMATGLGCLCSKDPDFTKGPSNWINSFAVVYFEKSGNFNIYPVVITDNKFIFEGKEYN